RIDEHEDGHGGIERGAKGWRRGGTHGYSAPAPPAAACASISGHSASLPGPGAAADAVALAGPPSSFMEARNSTLPGAVSVMLPPSSRIPAPPAASRRCFGAVMRTAPVTLATVTAWSAVSRVAPDWLCAATLPLAACSRMPVSVLGLSGSAA